MRAQVGACPVRPVKWWAWTHHPRARTPRDRRSVEPGVSVRGARFGGSSSGRLAALRIAGALIRPRPARSFSWGSSRRRRSTRRPTPPGAARSATWAARGPRRAWCCSHARQFRPVDDRRGGDDHRPPALLVHRGFGRRAVTIPLLVLGVGALASASFPATPARPMRCSRWRRSSPVELRVSRVRWSPAGSHWLSVVCGSVALLTLASYMMLQDAAPLAVSGPAGWSAGSCIRSCSG